MRRSTPSLLAASALSALLGLSTGMARSASPEESASAVNASRAEDYFKQGLAEYDAHRYRNAVDLFELAYRDSRAPALLFNMAQAWRLLGECQRATDLYTRFLAASPSSPDAGRARAWLKELGACAPAKRGLVISPLPRPGPATAPVVSLSSRPAQRPTPPATPVSGARSRAATALLALSTGLIGAAAVSAWNAHEASQETTNLFRSGGDWNASARAVDASGHRSETAAIVLVSAAVISAGAALVLRYWRPGHHRNGEAP